MNDLSIEYFYKKFEFRAGRINLISDYFFVWVGLPLLVVYIVIDHRSIIYHTLFLSISILVLLYYYYYYYYYYY